MRGIRERIEAYLELSGVSEIARRYFVMNAFDGVLTMLGIIIGAYLAGNVDRTFVLGAGISASIAIAVSGFSGSYVTEQAERTREMKKLESALLISLNGTRHEGAKRFAILFVSLIGGLSPALGAVIVVSPFFFDLAVAPEMAVFASVALALLTLFVLGIYLGHISEEKLILHGVKMLGVGIVTIIICTAALQLL
ncbi:MAG: VIT1/CCC1 transporter family protein [Candidatus Syntropharchaeales archaeon]